MLLIKLDATDSTNDYLKELLIDENPPDGTLNACPVGKRK